MPISSATWNRRAIATTQKKVVEENVLAKIESEFSRTVGGFLQKLEVYPTGDSAVVAYPGISIRYSRQSPARREGLGYLPVEERMGRNQR